MTTTDVLSATLRDRETVSMNYFAYGSNMDVHQMAMRCPDAVVVGTACLRGHRFLINTHGVATVVPSKREAVHGVLWEISKADEASLDHYEGVATGFYRKVIARVRFDDGNTPSALIYVARDDKPGRARPGYLERVVAAAKRHRLAHEYIKALRSTTERSNSSRTQSL